MTINSWLTKSEHQLKTAGIETARLDCMVLLEDFLDKDRAHLLANPDTRLTAEQEKALSHRILRRIKHEPLAYIRGKSEFYGREFLVNKHSLEPRPETETMIELASTLITLSNPFIKHIVDIGTGCGCIAVTMKKRFPQIAVTAIDIDAVCLETARKNAENHGVSLTLHQGNLLEPLETDADMLLCNLPYVPDSYKLNEAARHEPKLAIFGGKDGLDYYRQLFSQIDNRTEKPSHVLTEALPFQHHELSSIAETHGYKLIRSDDFIQHFSRKA